MSSRMRVLTLTHVESGRKVPVEVVTVVGRSDHYYHYTNDDERPDRLRDVADGLAALNYIKIDSDKEISRTHGMIDPELPGVCDLNSTNGTTLNGAKLPVRPGREGPLVTLADNDRIELGGQLFEVELREATMVEVTATACQRRHALVGTSAAGRSSAERTVQFLAERKGCSVRLALGWPAVIAGFYELQSRAVGEGLAVCVLQARVEGEQLFLDEEEMHFQKLLPLLAGVPGRKILALELKGDPSACEGVFMSEAFEDSILITSSGQMDFEEKVQHTNRSNLIAGMQDSLQGRSVPGAYDEIRDGLDALLAADTNILQVTWTKNYAGRLSIKFGQREHEEEEAISHSLRLGSTTFRF